MKLTSSIQALHAVFYVPPTVAEQALADWSFAEVARRHAPDLAPYFTHLALEQIAPYAAAVNVRAAA